MSVDGGFFGAVKHPGVRVAGHSSVSMSTRYVHPPEDVFLAAVEKLGGDKIGHSEPLSWHKLFGHSLVFVRESINAVRSKLLFLWSSAVC